MDPFVMLDHIGPERLPEDFCVGGRPHPHRGFETLTMMFEGVMHHVDSVGNAETLSSGSTQIMIAGSGIQHDGDMAADPVTHVFHEVQLWVNMPAVVLTGKPIGESVVMDGPFVMNTPSEIDDAHADFAAGKFGSIGAATKSKNLA